MGIFGQHKPQTGKKRTMSEKAADENREQKKSMEKTNKFAAVFLTAEIMFYAAYMCMDIFTGTDSSAIKFLSVALCFLASVAFLRKESFVPGALIGLALLLSLTADVFLLLVGTHYAAGVALFIAAQTVYALFIALRNGQNVWLSLTARALAGGAALFFAAKFAPGEILLSLAAVYAALSVCNIAQALTKRKTRLLAAGLILLLLCDFCVGIVNLNRFSPSAWLGELAVFANFGMWFFYLPSQVCIAFINLRLSNENTK